MKIKTIIYNIESSFLITVVRHGLAMMIPFILTGGIANALLNLPVKAYQNVISDSFFAHFLNIMYTGTFGFFSFAMLIALSSSYCMEKNMTVDKTVMYVIVAIGAFGTQLYNIGGGCNTDMLGVKGCFFAIVTALLSCILLEKLQKVSLFDFREQTNGVERITALAIDMLIPAAIVIVIFAIVVQSLVTVFDVDSLYEILSDAMCGFFDNVHNEFFKGLLYTLLLHIMWAFGLHGSMILEPVATTSFQIGASGEIFSQSFFYSFVVMGGCGTTICVLIAVLFWVKNTRLRKISELSIFTVIFNINEILTFGIPILLNPILIIPFICTPLLCYTVAYTATYIGIVPPVTHTVPWSVPIIFSGYLGTGSVAGSILQIVMIAAGVAIYVPFLRLNDRLAVRNAKEAMDGLISFIRGKEELNESYELLSQSGRIGQISRMLRHDLRTAIENKELYLLIQPQVNEKGRCIGGEALLRWKHPVYGLIYPPLIIYLAKASDLLEDMEKLIIDMTVFSIAEVSKECGPDFKISMNLTAKSFLWDVDKYIDKTLKKYNVKPSQLWLEITEQDVLSKATMVIEKMNHLKAQGHVMMIDDFGMGHTSILYLQSGDFGVVKLDGSLVKDILTNATNQQIVSSIVTLADRLHIKIIAEFVETVEQRDKLLELGCKWYQGYLYEKPVPLAEFIDFMEEHSLL